jgi:PKD repeat protein
MAYDSDASVVVYFGGYTTSSCSNYGGTWIYRNGTWEDAASYLGVAAPSPSRGSSLAWDSRDGYLLLYGGTSNSGALLSSTFVLYLNSTFLVRATASPSGGPAPFLVHFVASATGGAPPYTYAWDPGDGSANSSGAYLNHTYTTSGTYQATVLVNDSSTNSSEVRLQIVVTNNAWYNFPLSQVQPPWLQAAAMTYDPQINGVLLFGGQEENYPYVYSDQTWEYVGGVWQNISTSLPTSPSARYGASLVYDVNDSYALLFGGNSLGCTTLVGNYSGADFCNDTWTFTPSGGWIQIYPNLSPPARTEFAMADDPNDGYVVLFGGECSCGGYYYYTQVHDTWTFRGGQWTNWTSRTTKSPPSIVVTSATYDAAAGEVVMFGGANGCRSTGQTWTFAGGNWTQDSLGSQPPGDNYGSIAYDPALRATVLFGGETFLGSRCTYTIYNETWTFANGTWTDATSTTIGAPPQDYLTAMTYDEAAGAIVYVGDIGSYYGYYGYGATPAAWTWPGTPLVTNTTVTPSQGIAPFNVTFTASTTGGVSPYNDSWDFGDGSPNATGSPVTHEFTKVENYTVTLTANDSGGRLSVTYLSVVGFGDLLSLPTSTATLGQVPWAVHFYSNATGGVPPLTRSWSFGDGATSTSASPVHTYTTAGNYTAKLSLRDASGTTENWSFSIEAVPKLVAAPSSAPSVGQTPLTVNFTAGDTGGLGPFAYNWSFGDGSANSIAADPSHTFATAGVYTAGIEVVDSLHDVALATLTVRVTVPLSAELLATPTKGLAPLDVTFTDASSGGSLPYAISWNFGDGSSPGAGGVIGHTYTTPGNYTATESVTDAVGTVSQITVVITVVTPLAVTLSANTTLAVTSASVGFEVHPVYGEGPFSYSFKFGDGGTASGAASANHSFSTVGTFEVRATVTDALRETASAFVNVTVVGPLVARISAAPQTLTVGQTLNLSAGSAGGLGPYVYTWTGLPTGCSSSGTSIVSCQPSDAQNYTISVTVSDRSRQNSTASTWVLVTAASTGTGGAGSGSTLPGGSLLWILIAVAAVVVVAIALILVRQRRPPPSEDPAPEEPVGESYEVPPWQEPEGGSMPSEGN